MKIDGLTHPKTKQLAISLGVSLPHAVGLLEFLFHFTAKQTPQGNIGKWPDSVIAAECGWDSCAEKFVKSLIDCGFLDGCEQHRLIVHDWEDHAPRWVFAKLKRDRKEVLSPVLSGDLKADYKPSLAKPSQAKPRQGKATNGASAPTLTKPEWLDTQVWNDYRSFRTSKKAKLTPTAWSRIQAEIERGIEKGHDPNDMLGEAMEAGWTGFKVDWYENRLSGNRGKPASDAAAAARKFRAERNSR